MKSMIFLVILLLSVQAKAQDISAGNLDAAARSAKATSIMFAAPQDEEEAARARYEAEMRAREAYEAEMRKREEEIRRMEEERRRALRPVNLFGNTLKIYAVINGDVLTSRDMQDRANAFVATTQIPITSKNREIVLERVFQGAIDEKIKLQEASKKGIKITAKELEEGVKNFAQSNGISLSEFRAMLNQAQVDEKVFLNQMKAEMAWGRLVQMKAAQNLKVSRSDIQRVMAGITKDAKKQKFMVSEIVIAKKDAKHIGELVQTLREDPRFELYAMQFSQSPTAKNGGHLGWVSSEQLPEKLSAVLKNMKAGGISNPIAVGSDYYILKLEQKYMPGVDKMPEPNEKEIRKMLENKKIEEIASKYLRDLRNKAIIERKA
ncbi:MAG: peptidylprolyl isomerase [Alphaproteobacteria bacterium]|nr:peptidylprolyl isomerase [Alphaproteobacteria bacterium]